MSIGEAILELVMHHLGVLKDSYLAEEYDGIFIVQPLDFFCPIELSSCSIHLEVDGLRGVQIHNMIQHVLVVCITSYEM